MFLYACFLVGLGVFLFVCFVRGLFFRMFFKFLLCVCLRFLDAFGFLLFWLDVLAFVRGFLFGFWCYFNVFYGAAQGFLGFLCPVLL